MYDDHPQVATYQHADDVTANCVVEEPGQLHGCMYRYATTIAFGIKKLRLRISEKSTAVPSSETTRKAARLLRQSGVTIKVKASGTHLGISTTSGTTRTTARIGEGATRASMAEKLTRIDRRAGKLANIAIVPTQSYGRTVVRASMARQARCRANFVCASGQMTAGVCITTASKPMYCNG